MTVPLLTLQQINASHEARFLDAVTRSRNLHHPWVSPASNVRQFSAHLEKYKGDSNIGLLAINQEEELVACINLNEIVRGVFQSAYMGYYAFEPFAGKGLMYQAMGLAIDFAFNELGLHRLEANIQPKNTRSKYLVQALGFRLEGFSPHYLRIGNEWKDHERYALTLEDLS